MFLVSIMPDDGLPNVEIHETVADVMSAIRDIVGHDIDEKDEVRNVVESGGKWRDEKSATTFEIKKFTGKKGS